MYPSSYPDNLIDLHSEHMTELMKEVGPLVDRYGLINVQRGLGMYFHKLSQTASQYPELFAEHSNALLTDAGRTANRIWDHDDRKLIGKRGW